MKKNFTTKKPDLVWVSNITHIKVLGHFMYLCVIIDLYSQKVIAYCLKNKMDASLVEETFKKAYERRNQPKNLIFYSDRVSQYISKTFRRLLDEMDVIQSFSAKGYPYDNAVAESFFKFVKT